MQALKKEPEMENSPTQLDTRVARLETHMEHMASNISRIMEALLDLRTSTEAKFELIIQKFDGRFDGVNGRFDGVNQKFEGVNQKFDAVNQKFEGVNQKFDAVNQKFEGVNEKFDGINQKFEQVNERISMLHVSMTEKFGEVKVWALTVLGGGLGFGILSIVARALHWI